MPILIPRKTFSRLGGHEIILTSQHRNSRYLSDIGNSSVGNSRKLVSRPYMLVCESQQLCAKLVLSHVKLSDSDFDACFWNARPSTHKQRRSMRPATPAHIPHSCRYELSRAAEDAASPVSAKGKEGQSGCWHRNRIFSPSRANICRLTAHIPPDGQPSSTSQCSRLLYLRFRFYGPTSVLTGQR